MKIILILIIINSRKMKIKITKMRHILITLKMTGKRIKTIDIIG